MIFLLFFVISGDDREDLISCVGLCLLRGLVLLQRGLDLVLQLLQFLFGIPDMLQYLFPLFLELLLLFHTAFTQLLILAHDPLAVFPRGAVLALHRLIALHDIADIIDGRQEITHALRLDQQEKHAEAAFLLHGTDTGTVSRKLLILHRPGLLDLDGLLRDLPIVDGKLLVQNLYGRLCGAFFLIQRQLLLQHIRLLLLQSIHSVFGLPGAGSQLFLFLFQLFDLAFIYGKRGRKHGNDQAQNHDDRHDQCQDRYDFFTVHNLLLTRKTIKPSNNS